MFARTVQAKADSSPQRIVGFLDPSALPSNPGWPLRNLLTYLAHRHPTFSADGIRILCWRDSEPPSDGHWKSRFGIVTSSASVQGAVFPAQP